jgi:hypothetical protein
VGAETASLISEAWPYVSAAVGAYGGAVLAKTEDQAADATVKLGRRLLQRIFRNRVDPPPVLARLAADPQDGTLQAALRTRLSQMLAEDSSLADEISQILADAHTAHIKATGERSVAAHTVTGIVVTGDHSTIHRHP